MRYFLHGAFATLLICTCSCRNPITFFNSHKRIRNVSIAILKLENNSDSNWTEYNYYFEQQFSRLIDLPSTLRIGFYNRNNFDCRVSLNNKNLTKVEGYSKQIVDYLEDSFGITTEYITLNESLLVEEYLENDIVDIVICDYQFSGDKKNILQLYPTIRSRQIIIYDPTELNVTRDIFILTFVGKVWLTFLIVSIALAVCLRITTVQYSKMHRKHISWSWVEITVWAIAAACQQGLSYEPKRFTSRVIFFLGYLLAYLLYTGFAAGITSVLLQNEINYVLNLNRTYQLKTLCLEGTAVCQSTKYLESTFPLASFVKDLDAAFTSSEKHHAVVAPRLLTNKYSNKLLKRKISNLFTEYYKLGFLVAYNSKWRNIIRKGLLQLEHSGILKAMLSRNFHLRPQEETYYSYSSVGIEHVKSAILLLGGGIVISVLFSLGECILIGYKSYKS